MNNFDRLILQRVIWQETKGKLNAMLELFGPDQMEKYKEMDELVQSFIKKIDDDSPIS